MKAQGALLFLMCAVVVHSQDQRKTIEYIPIDTNSPLAKDSAKIALRKIEDKYPDMAPVELNSIVSAEEKNLLIGSGVRLNMIVEKTTSLLDNQYNCEVVVFSTLFGLAKNIASINCELMPTEYPQDGWVSINQEDLDAKIAANISISIMEQKYYKQYAPLSLIKIFNASRTELTGSKFVKVAMDVRVMPELSHRVYLGCEATVEILMNTSTRFVEGSCINNSVKPNFSEWTQIDKDNDVAKDAVTFALAEMNKKRDLLSQLYLGKIDSAEKKIMSDGSLVRVNIVAIRVNPFLRIQNFPTATGTFRCEILVSYTSGNDSKSIQTQDCKELPNAR